MTLQILEDMNLSPDWIDWFKGQQWQAVHWSEVGDPRAMDQIILHRHLAVVPSALQNLLQDCS